MNKLIISIFLVGFAIIHFGCNKEPETFEIKGTVSNTITQAKIEGVTVYLDGKKMVNGVYNSSFSLISQTSTDANGNFTLSVTEEKISDYRFRTFKTGYFDSELALTTDQIQTDQATLFNIKVYQQAQLDLTIKNQYPQNNDDEINFHLSNIKVTGPECCNTAIVTGIGPTYLSSQSCKVQSDDYIHLMWTVKKNGNQQVFIDSIFTHNGETVIYNINY